MKRYGAFDLKPFGVDIVNNWLILKKGDPLRAMSQALLLPSDSRV